LILDESTSAIDGSTKNRVVENICEAFGGRIVLFVTHDWAILDKVACVVDLQVMNKADELKFGSSVRHLSDGTQAVGD
jgi:ABC-type transport system involved in cytochrome bd biosynthesis fused ATPase/permease subunit